MWLFSAPALAGAACSNTLPGEIQTAFEQLHTLSEALYDGHGSWGYANTGYHMALRDSAWRADVYGDLASLSPQYRQRADEAADYLVHAQQAGASGVFGMPADEKNPEFGSRVRQIKKRCPDCLHNGWIVTLPGDHVTALYYDHGFALAALARAYLRSGNNDWLQAVRHGAEWAMHQPATENINYLSTLSKGLSLASHATGDARYLEEAVRLHRTYILPGLNQAGHARDAHNAQLEYHAFIVSGLATLRQHLPNDHALVPELDRALAAAIDHLTQRCLQDSAGEKASWPGAALLAWHDVAAFRPLSAREQQALARTLNLASRQTSGPASTKPLFHRQKLLSINFPLGFYLNGSATCLQALQ